MSTATIALYLTLMLEREAYLNKSILRTCLNIKHCTTEFLHNFPPKKERVYI